MGLKNRDGVGGIHHIGHILAGGNEDCGQTVGGVSVVTHDAGLQLPHQGRLPDAEQLVRRYMQVQPHYPVGEKSTSGDALPFSAGHEESAGAFL